MEYNEFDSHFVKQIPQDIMDYIQDVALKDSRYLFTKRAAGIQFAYCTHCGKTSRTDGLKHNGLALCPNCGSNCKVKSDGMGRSKLIDEAYLVWYGKSPADSSAVTARGIYVVRDYSGDYKKTQTLYTVLAMYLFQPGNHKEKGKGKFGKSTMWVHGKQSAKVYSVRDISARRAPLFINEENIRAAVHGTQLQYCKWEDYVSYYDEEHWQYYGLNHQYKRNVGEPEADLVTYFDLATRYPCTEYLMKLGMHKIVEEKLSGHSMRNCINWRGATIEKVLKLSKQEVRELVNADVDPTQMTLHSYRFHKYHMEGGISLTFDQAHEVRELADFSNHLVCLTEIKLPYKEIVRYSLQQLRRPGAKSIYSGAAAVVRNWRDYLKECKELNYDISKSSVLIPNDLSKAHEDTSKLIKMKQDKALDDKIANRLKELNKLIFEDDQFIVRPVRSGEEMYQEGKALSHCVGRYADGYAKGACNIFVIRHKNDPDTPFYTMEIKGDKIIQVQGKKHILPTKEVSDFLKLFVSKKILTKKRVRFDMSVLNMTTKPLEDAV